MCDIHTKIMGTYKLVLWQSHKKKVRQFDWEKRQKGVAAHTKQGECVKKKKTKKKTRRFVVNERVLWGSHTIWSGKV